VTIAPITLAGSSGEEHEETFSRRET
jgi:hypothetical protein